MTDTPDESRNPDEDFGMTGESVSPTPDPGASSGPMNETTTGTMPQAKTEGKKSGKLAVAITAGLAGLVVGGLVTGLIVTQAGNSDASSGAQAKSTGIWHSVNHDSLPEGWEQIGEQGGETALERAQSPISVTSVNNCHFTVTQSMLEAPEFEGTPADYHAVNLVLGYGSYRDATDTDLKEVEIETTEGKTNFWASTYTLEYDIDGDGENDSVRETRMAHAYPEAVDTEGRIPVTEIGYVCNDATQFSEEEVLELASAFTFNISGDEPPALETPEEPDATEGESESTESEESSESTDTETVESEPNEAEQSESVEPTAPTDGETTANPDDVVDERDASEAPSDVETSEETVDATEGNMEGVEGKSDQ